MNYKFTAKSCIFNNMSGYILKQWHNGEIIATQFIAAERFKAYCSTFKINPIFE